MICAFPNNMFRCTSKREREKKKKWEKERVRWKLDSKLHWAPSVRIACRAVTGSRVMSEEVATVEVLLGEEAKHNSPVASLKTPSSLPSSRFNWTVWKIGQLTTSALLLLLSLSLTGMSPARSLRGVWAASVAMELTLYRLASVVMVTRVRPGPNAPTCTSSWTTTNKV